MKWIKRLREERARKVAIKLAKGNVEDAAIAYEFITNGYEKALLLIKAHTR